MPDYRQADGAQLLPHDGQPCQLPSRRFGPQSPLFSDQTRVTAERRDGEGGEEASLDDNDVAGRRLGNSLHLHRRSGIEVPRICGSLVRVRHVPRPSVARCE